MKVINFLLCMLHTVITYLCVGMVIMVFVLPLMILLALLPLKKCRHYRVIFWLLDMIYRGVVWSAWVPVSLKGNLVLEKPAIIIANHQSAVDIPLLGLVANGKPHVWYAMSYYATVPILGFFVRRLGIPVDRGSGSTAARCLREGIKYAQECDSHIMIFPEGGRFNDGSVHDFLHGFALLARKTGRPVIPVFMPHNGKVYPPHTFLIYYYPLEVVIGPQFVYDNQETDELFVQRVHAWFDHQLQK